jgi:hypothetical protein
MTASDGRRSGMAGILGDKCICIKLDKMYADASR